MVDGRLGATPPDWPPIPRCFSRRWSNQVPHRVAEMSTLCKISNAAPCEQIWMVLTPVTTSLSLHIDTVYYRDRELDLATSGVSAE